MHFIDFLILGVILVCVILAILYLVKNRGCPSSCCKNCNERVNCKKCNHIESFDRSKKE